MKQIAFVFAGAMLGGAVGHFAFGWLYDQGFYGLVLPGGLLGLGAGSTNCRSRWPSVACGILALVLGLFTEWRFRPFIADDSLHYFLTHPQKLKPLTLLMIAAGTAMGFWVPFRRVASDHGSNPRSSA